MKCIKSLYKSTYKRLAFKKGKKYEIVEEDSEFFWLKDELGHSFNFAKELKENNTFYIISDYFDI